MPRALFLLPRGLPPRLVEAVLQHLLRVARGPTQSGSKASRSVPPGAEPKQDVANIGPWLQTMTPSLPQGIGWNRTAARGPKRPDSPETPQFFRPIAWIRTVRSETLLSIVRRPSLTNCRNAVHAGSSQ